MPVLCYKLISFYSFKIIPFVIKFRLLSVLISDFKNKDNIIFYLFIHLNLRESNLFWGF